MEFIKNVLVGLLAVALFLLPILIVIFIVNKLFGVIGVIALPFVVLFVLIFYCIGSDIRGH